MLVEIAHRCMGRIYKK